MSKTISPFDIGLFAQINESFQSENTTNHEGIWSKYFCMKTPKIIEFFPQMFEDNPPEFDNNDSELSWTRFTQMNQNTETTVAIKIISNKLGDWAAERVSSFSESPDGWDFGTGKSLQFDSLHQFTRFCSTADVIDSMPSQEKVSLFMDEEGTIEILLEKPSSQSMYLNFEGNEIRYLIDGEEDYLNCSFEEGIALTREFLN